MKKHFKDTKILLDCSRTSVECKHCPGTHMDSKHLSDWSSIACVLFKIDIDCIIDALCREKAEDVTKQWFTPLARSNFYHRLFLCTYSYTTPTTSQFKRFWLNHCGFYKNTGLNQKISDMSAASKYFSNFLNNHNWRCHHFIANKWTSPYLCTINSKLHKI